MTGATLIDNEYEALLSEFKPEYFGKAQLIKVTELETSIVDGNCDPQAFETRKEEIKA